METLAFIFEFLFDMVLMFTSFDDLKDKYPRLRHVNVFVFYLVYFLIFAVVIASAAIAFFTIQRLF